jgi:hypothetical protein
MGKRGPPKDPARERALEEGRSTYWSSTSRKCLRGHVSERYTSNKRCVECDREADPWELRAQGRSHKDLIRRGFPKRGAFQCA